MRAQDQGPAGKTAVPGTPSGKAQGDTATDAADPATSVEQRERRIGSGGGGAYPVGPDDQGGRR